MGPMRPKYIASVITSFPMGESSGVALREVPTVPKADETS